MRRMLAGMTIVGLLALGSVGRADPEPLVVVLYSDLALEGDLDRPYDPSQEGTCSYPFDCENLVRTAKAIHRYFERTTDTGGRNVRMFAMQSSGGIGSHCAVRQADAKAAQEAFEPDLVAHFGAGMDCFVRELAEAGVPTFGLNGLRARTYSKFAPHVWTFSPTAEMQADLSAAYICRKLAGRPARFAGDPQLRSQRRHFGFVRPVESARGTEFDVQSDALRTKLAERCGVALVTEEFSGSSFAPGPEESVRIMARLKLAGVTTVICHCVPVVTETTVPQMQAAATALGFLPEWYWDTPSFMDRASWQKLFQTKAPGGSFGWTWLWRVGELQTTAWYAAYESEEPGTAPNGRHLWSLYHTFWLTYRAIEAGNPTHDPQSIKDGLFTLSIGEPADPFGPVGSFGPSGPGPYALVDTGMGYWWDEIGTPPGGIPVQGCIRVTNQGLRAHADEWPAGDDDLFLADDPCSQATSRIYVL